jgi:hypothetical protein
VDECKPLVLGIRNDGGEEGWKEKMADKILARQNDKDAAAGGGGGGDGEGDDQPPVA